jgi:hypothetical protein
VSDPGAGGADARLAASRPLGSANGRGEELETKPFEYHLANSVSSLEFAKHPSRDRREVTVAEGGRAVQRRLRITQATKPFRLDGDCEEPAGRGLELVLMRRPGRIEDQFRRLLFRASHSCACQVAAAHDQDEMRILMRVHGHACAAGMVHRGKRESPCLDHSICFAEKLASAEP